MKTSDQFSALGHDLRLSLFRFIIRQGERGCTPGEIAAAFDMPGSTRSTHLKRLVRSGLLSLDGEGSKAVYRVNPDSLRKLVRFLVEECCDSDPSLCGVVLKP